MESLAYLDDFSTLRIYSLAKTLVNERDSTYAHPLLKLSRTKFELA
jgi:hypothetical protein